MGLEVVPIECRWVGLLVQEVKVLFKVFQLAVFLSFVVGDDGNSIVLLEGVTIGAVINEEHSVRLPVGDHPEILDEDVLVNLVAVRPTQDDFDVFALGIDVVHDLLGVVVNGCCKDADVKPLR